MTDRPQPSLNRWHELTVPPEDLAELAGWLTELREIRSGRVRPGAVKQHPVTAKLTAYRDLAERGAREAAAARALASPSTRAAPVVAPAQITAPSEAGEITTAQAAALTGLSAERMRQLAASGKVRARRAGHRAWLLDRSDVIALNGRSTDGTGSGEDTVGTREPGGTAGTGAARRSPAA